MSVDICLIKVKYFLKRQKSDFFRPEKKRRLKIITTEIKLNMKGG